MRRAIPAKTQLFSLPTVPVPHKQICLEMGTWLPSYGPGAPSVLVLRDEAWRLWQSTALTAAASLLSSCPSPVLVPFAHPSHEHGWQHQKKWRAPAVPPMHFWFLCNCPFLWHSKGLQCRRKDGKERMERLNSHGVIGTKPWTPSPGLMEINNITLNFLMRLF